MKKVIYILFTFAAIFLVNSVHAMPSESFTKMLEIMNIPIKNNQGYEINEEMYNKYGLIVYGKPQDVIKNQRWKDVTNRKMDK